jgi:tRNA(Arg) A34 adenosine deaminase TadA
METGVGCELCKEVCEQDAHAEVNAIRLAGERSHGATLYLEGHAYACDSCKTAAFFARIAAINVGAPPPIEPDSGAGVAA